MWNFVPNSTLPRCNKELKTLSQEDNAIEDITQLRQRNPLFPKDTVSAGYLMTIFVHNIFLQKQHNESSFTVSRFNAATCRLQHTNRN